MVNYERACRAACLRGRARRGRLCGRVPCRVIRGHGVGIGGGRSKAGVLVGRCRGGRDLHAAAVDAVASDAHVVG